MSMRWVVALVALGLSAASWAQDSQPVEDAGVAETAADAALTPEFDPPALFGDAARGEGLSAVCAACHGLDGNSVDPINPKLAGQHELYTYRQLKLFKSGARENAIMLGFASLLSHQDMRDIGAWFASQRVQAGVANDGKIRDGEDLTWAELGRRLYQGGDAERQIPACMACHGPTGTGNPGSAFPALAGQHADYTRLKLTEFRDGMVWGNRTDGHPITENANLVMAGVAKYLSDEDIEALSTYIEGLHRAERRPTGRAVAGN
jgi:cytochrome c553